ncbi:MAG: hypothetical protein PBU96_08590 [Stenotrophomonas geniculata]
MKRSQFCKAMFAALACASSVTAVAATTPTPTGPVGLNVKVGGVISPGSCTPESGAVSFDMKKIRPTALLEKAATPLAAAAQPLVIKCDGGDTAVMLSVAGAVMAAVASDKELTHASAGINAGAKSGYIYDLVDAKDSSKRIGRYAFQFRNFRYKTAASTTAASDAVVVTSTDKVTWAKAAETATNAAQLKADGSSYLTFADPATPAVPVRASVFSGNVVIGAALQPKSELVITDDLTFRGETTITLAYL